MFDDPQILKMVPPTIERSTDRPLPMFIFSRALIAEPTRVRSWIESGPYTNAEAPDEIPSLQFPDPSIDTLDPINVFPRIDISEPHMVLSPRLMMELRKVRLTIDNAPPTVPDRFTDISQPVAIAPVILTCFDS
jgi:hypothetical protein